MRDVVRWGQSPLTFELRSSDTVLLERAAVIFRPWQCFQSTQAVYSWTVEPTWRGGRQGWEIRSSVSTEVLYKEQCDQALLSVEFYAVQTLLEHPQCPLSLHGALVAKEGKGVLIVGRGEAGKSTLACALWQNGWSLLCDDAMLIDTDQRRAYPTPRRVSLRSPSRALLGEALWTRISQTLSYDQTTEGCVFHPCELDGQERQPVVPLVSVLFLGRSGSTVTAAACHRVEPAHALLSLAPYANFIRRYDLWETMRRLQPVVMTLPVYDLGRGPLPEMIKSVEAVLSEAV
jgi:hypothetical protein